MKDQPIAITGFMAAGKTTVGRALASTLGCPFVDLDELIATQADNTIGHLIRTKGEDFFRDLETKALAGILRENRPRVIALGGGAWSRVENRQLLKEGNASVVWLDAPFDLCWQRIETGADRRPLAPSREAAEKLFHQRQAVYELADVRAIVSPHKTVEEIAEEIGALLLQRKSHR